MGNEYYAPSEDWQFSIEVPQNVNRCVAHASPFFINSTKYFRQCTRKPGYGPGGQLCVQHARLALNCFAEHE